MEFAAGCRYGWFLYLLYLGALGFYLYVRITKTLGLGKYFTWVSCLTTPLLPSITASGCGWHTFDNKGFLLLYKSTSIPATSLIHPCPDLGCPSYCLMCHATPDGKLGTTPNMRLTCPDCYSLLWGA